MQKALAFDEAGLPRMARAAYDGLTDLLDEKIRTKDIAVPLIGTDRQYQTEQLIKRLTLRQMDELLSDGEQMRQLSTEDR